MEEEREEGLTFGDIFAAIKRQIWVVLAITLAGTIAVSLVVGLFLNPRSVEYEMSFNLLYPSSAVARYPDGSPFYDFDIVSAEFLNKAKSSDESFAHIDVERMVRNNGIRLSKQQMETGSDIYTITVKGSYFTNRDEAEKFIRATAQVPVTEIVENAQTVNYQLDSNIFAGASFKEKLELLSSLKETLLKALDEWIGVFGATYRVNGISLGNYRSAVYVVYGDSTREILESEFETNGYDGLDIGSYDTIDDAIEARKQALRAEQTLNEAIIEALKGEGNGAATARTYALTDEEEKGGTKYIVEQNPNMDSAEMIAYYTKRNAQIHYQVYTSLTTPNVVAFEARLKEQLDELQNAADTVATVTSSVYAQDHNTAVSFHTQKAQQSGGMSMVLVIIGAIVVSFLLSVIVAYFVNGRTKKKEKQAEKQDAVQPEEK